MASLEQFGGLENTPKTPDLLAELMKSAVADLEIEGRLEKLTEGDPDAPKLKEFLTSKTVEVLMKVDANQVKEAANNLRNNSDMLKLGSSAEIDQALSRLENLTTGNLEVSKAFATILLAVFAPKEGIPALLKSGTDGVSQILQAIYTNAEVIGNLSAEARIDSAKMEAFNKAKSMAEEAGIEFNEAEYEDPSHLKVLAGGGKILDATIIKMQNLSAEGGKFLLEGVESVLHKTGLLPEDKSFTQENPELVQLVTREGLSPLEKKVFAKFLREVVVVAASKQLKEEIIDGHINKITTTEHDKEVAAANDNSEGTANNDLMSA